MIYMGSKARFAKELLPIILKDRKEGQQTTLFDFNENR